MDAGAGNVIIKPLSGQLTHDTDTWGKMDPYCKVKIGAQTEKSKTCTDGGKFPSWTDSMSFRRDKEDLINVEIWDSDVGKDDLIGQGALALSTVFTSGNKYNGWVDLTYKGKSAGKVLIDVQYFPDKSKTTTTTTSTSGTYQIPTMGMTMQMQPTMMQQIPTTSIYTQPTVYQQPIYTQPTVYQQPIYQQQQPIYQQQQPIYQQQQQQPIYQQPTVYQQPTQQQQVYQQPIYQQPTQQQQVYQQPTQQQQVYQQPTQQIYQQPTQQQQFTQQQQVYPTQQQQFGGYPQQKF